MSICLLCLLFSNQISFCSFLFPFPNSSGKCISSFFFILDWYDNFQFEIIIVSEKLISYFRLLVETKSVLLFASLLQVLVYTCLQPPQTALHTILCAPFPQQIMNVFRAENMQLSFPTRTAIISFTHWEFSQYVGQIVVDIYSRLCLLRTRNIASQPHRQFVFFSSHCFSIDIYHRFLCKLIGLNTVFTVWNVAFYLLKSRHTVCVMLVLITT